MPQDPTAGRPRWAWTPIVFAFLIVLQAAAQNGVEPRPIAPEAALKLITADYMRKHIDVVAGDAMEGRMTGSPGGRKAADYIVKQLEGAGVTAAFPQSNYFQPWDMKSAPSAVGSSITWRRGSRKGRIEGQGQGNDRPFEIFAFSGAGGAKGEVVFAGYGITAPEYGYDDYAGLAVEGKIVLVLRGEPRMQRADGWLGKDPTPHADFEAKYENARTHGVAALLIVTDPLNYEGRARRPQPHRGGRPQPVPPAADAKPRIPAVWLDYDAMVEMLGLEFRMEKRQTQIDDALAPRSEKLGVQAEIDLKEGGVVQTQNIVAWLEGSDPILKDEFIVLGAHYDHVGMKAADPKSSRKEDRIFNGADDNGSGTVTLMAIAQALGRSGLKPKRSIVFVFFSGEEEGLLGSEYYVNQRPVFPIERTVAMLNMDMVGRNLDNGCEIVGTQFSPDLRRVLEGIGRDMKFEMTFSPGGPPENILERSDQGPFYKRSVPVAFFTTGEHADYHKVSDEPALIKVKNMAKVGQLILRSALAVSEAETKPAFTTP